MSSKKDMSLKTANGLRKVPMWLIPPVALVELAQAFREGAYESGYGPYNWRDEPVSASVYASALLRHYSDWLDRVDLDPHCTAFQKKSLAGVMAACAILLDAEAQGTLIDDRPTAGKARELLDSLEVPAVESELPVAEVDLPQGKKENIPGGIPGIEEPDSAAKVEDRLRHRQAPPYVFYSTEFHSNSPAKTAAVKAAFDKGISNIPSAGLAAERTRMRFKIWFESDDDPWVDDIDKVE